MSWGTQSDDGEQRGSDKREELHVGKDGAGEQVLREGV
jgi:hypothetical protein